MGTCLLPERNSLSLSSLSAHILDQMKQILRGGRGSSIASAVLKWAFNESLISSKRAWTFFKPLRVLRSRMVQ